MGADLYCLHKNKWWQTAAGRCSTPARSSPGSSTRRGSTRPSLGKPSAAYFAAALDALGAEPELTWMVTDDIEAGCAGRPVLRHADGARSHGEVPARDARALGIVPEIVLSSVAQLPDWLERSL